MLAGFRLVRSVIMSLVFAGGCSYVGVSGIAKSCSYTEPAPQTCAEFAAAPKTDGWVRLKGCEALPLHAAYSEMKRRSSEGEGWIDEVAVPVRAAGAEVDDAPIVLVSREELHKKRADDMRHFDESRSAKDKLFVALQLARPYAVPEFQAQVLGPPKSSGNALAKTVDGGVAANAVVLEQADGSGRPDWIWPLICVIAGIFWGLSLFATFARIAKGGDAEPAGEPPPAT